MSEKTQEEIKRDFNNLLAKIQSELKAPKTQTNKYMKYKYRSCEDILKAIKPYLFDNSLTLILDDELVAIGDRYYIKATATLNYLGKEKISVCGYAREEEKKQGMDLCQITGACSSYARKYALNGLLLIDDNKDSDNTNTGKKPESRDDQMNAMSGVNKDLNIEATKQIEARNKAIDSYAILLKIKNPSNKDDLLRDFKRADIKTQRELYKKLQAS